MSEGMSALPCSSCGEPTIGWLMRGNRDMGPLCQDCYTSGKAVGWWSDADLTEKGVMWDEEAVRERVNAASQAARYRPEDAQMEHAHSVLVPIPDHMADVRELVAEKCGPGSEYDRDTLGRVCFRIDACIVEALKAVWAAGYRTLGCCCGHGQEAGGIITIDNGTYSLHPRTGTQARFEHIHDGGGDPYADPGPEMGGGPNGR